MECSRSAAVEVWCCSTSTWQCHQNYCSIIAEGITCNFVPDEFGGLNVAHTAEQTPQFVLAHALRQVVDNQVGSGIIVLHHLLAVSIIIELLSSHTHTHTYP